MSEESKPQVDRRRLLRRAGAVAAGIGAASVAATPAAAAEGDNLVQGANTVVPTTFTGNSASAASLTLANPSGAALNLAPATSLSTAAPVGSVYVDAWGDVFTVGNVYDSGGTTGPKYITPIYSSTWATMTMPITPMRWLVTIDGFVMPNGWEGRDFVVPGSANYDGQGRLLPKGSDSTPDLILDFSLWFGQSGFCAVQGNISILAGAMADGWCSLYPGGENWPGTSTTGFSKASGGWNFSQTTLDDSYRMNVKVSTPAVLVFDIMGFILSDPITQFAMANAEGNAAQRALAQTPIAAAQQRRTAAPRRD